MPHSTLERPKKRAKLQEYTAPSTEHTFVNAQDICEALRNANPDVFSKGAPGDLVVIQVSFFPLEALLALRSKLSVSPGETVPPQDERLQLVKSWLEMSPGAQDIFDAWERISQVGQCLASYCSGLPE